MNRVSEQGGNAANGKPAKELVAAMNSMQSSELSFADFRDELANALYLDFRQASGIEAWLVSMEISGELPSHLFRVLESDIQRICAEDVPTLIDTSSMLLKRKTSEAEKPATQKKPPSPAQPPTDMAARRRSASENTLSQDKPTQRAIKVGDVLCGRYEIIAMADGGNMSQVFQAKDSSAKDQSDALCAIKALAPTMAGNGRALRALQDEYEKGALCSHPNIVKYRGLERDGSLIFVVMEWLAGETLADFLNARPGIAQSQDWSRHVLEQLSAALGAVHDEGLVHADIKPGNVMLMPDGQLKLFDFGVARAFGEKRAKHIGFDAGVLGAATPAYASAALLNGKAPLPVDDWYSTACIAYRLLSGVRVFGRESALDAKANALTPERIESLTDVQWHTLTQYLQHSGAERPGSFEAMLDALLPADAEVPAFFSQRRIAWWSATAAIALVAAVVFWRQQPVTQVSPIAIETEVADAGSEQPVPDTGARNEPTITDNLDTAAVIDEPIVALKNGSDAANYRDEQTISQVAPYTPIADTVYVQLAIGDARFSETDYARRSSDGEFQVQLGLPSEAGQPVSVRAFLAPIDAPDQHHALRLETTGSVQVEPSGNATLTLRPFENSGLEAHRAYRLWVADADDLASVRAAMNIRILNPALISLASVSEPNTVGFLKPEIQVNESDTAIKVSLLRLNPDDQTLVAGFVVQSLSASADEDFFAPLATTVTFGPGEAEAKILLPLLNDELAEAAESLMIELNGVTNGDLMPSVTVVINDDD